MKRKATKKATKKTDIERAFCSAGAVAGLKLGRGINTLSSSAKVAGNKAKRGLKILAGFVKNAAVSYQTARK